MPALSVIDLAMFLLETRERPFSVGPLVVLAPPRGFRGNFADKLVRQMLRRPLGEPFSYRLRTPRLGLPSLEVDPDGDPAKHVHRLTLAAPGSIDVLCATVCNFHEIPIDRSRLLWDLYVIDGLEDGKVAVYAKVHHGIIDGRTFVEVMSSWLATSPDDKTVHAMWEGVTRAPRPSRARASFAATLGSVLSGATGTAASVAGLYRMLARQALTSAGLGKGMGLPLIRVPKAFHGRAAAARTYAYCTLSLAEVKTVAKLRSATVNDVLLTVLDAAMARLLHEAGELPHKALVADMPLALQQASGGNQIAVLQFALGIPGASLIERLAEISKTASSVKDLLKRESADTVMLFTTLIHGIPALAERLGLNHGLRVSNVLVSNPFGLPEERYLMGARVELALPMSVISAGQMLNVTAVTLAEKLQIGFLAIPQAVRHVGKLADYTREAFEALKQAALQSATTARKTHSAQKAANSSKAVARPRRVVQAKVAAAAASPVRIPKSAKSASIARKTLMKSHG